MRKFTIKRFLESESNQQSENDKFNRVDILAEWISFLKTGDIQDDAKAPRLEQARQCLAVDKITFAEYKEYARYMDNIRYQRSVIRTAYDDGWQDGRAIAEGEYEKSLQIAKAMLTKGFDAETVAEMVGLPVEEIKRL